jgi:hypothetical protein
MKTKKIIIAAVAFILSLFLVWYFVKESDYYFIQSKTATGTVFRNQ